MKVLLLKSVPKLGKKDEVVEVSDGYAHNALFPKRLAIPATPAELVKLEKRKQSETAELYMQSDLLAKALEQLQEKQLVLKARANKQGHLFAKITAADIAHFLLIEHRLSIPAEAIHIAAPIKETGTLLVPVSFNAFQGSFTLTIQAV